jgi:uncharacterized damage-inducible protein DinB
MQPIENYRDLFTHSEWADATMWSGLHSYAAASEEENMHRLLYHVHAAQHAFLLCWKGEPLELPKHEEFKDFPALEAWARDYYAKLHDFLGTLDLKSLDGNIDIPWAQGFEKRFGEKPAALTLADTMNQAYLHSVHHRAQVCGNLRALGAEPPTVDYILWGWLGKPTPNWIP